MRLVISYHTRIDLFVIFSDDIWTTLAPLIHDPLVENSWLCRGFLFAAWLITINWQACAYMTYFGEHNRDWKSRKRWFSGIVPDCHKKARVRVWIHSRSFFTILTTRTCICTVHVCDVNPCQNGGTCSEVAGAASCACVTGYTGTTCSGKCTYRVLQSKRTGNNVAVNITTLSISNVSEILWLWS